MFPVPDHRFSHNALHYLNTKIMKIIHACSQCRRKKKEKNCLNGKNSIKFNLRNYIIT